MLSLISVIVIKDGLVGEGLGLEMYEAQRDGKELEVLNLELPQDLEKLEQLICQMTSYQLISKGR